MRDFYAAKAPSSQEKRIAVFLYYLDAILELSGITQNHVYTCFNNVSVKCPVDLPQIMRNTASQNGWIDTSKKDVLKVGNAFRLKPTSREIVRSWIQSILKTESPRVDQENGYIPGPVWTGTRGYIAKVAEQINASFQFELYDGASVLTRRLVETLLVECFEYLKIANRITDAHGNYVSLSSIIGRVIDHRDLTLSKDARAVLTEIRKNGNRSAHNYRYLANKSDLERTRSDVRVAIEELLHMANLK